MTREGGSANVRWIWVCGRYVEVHHHRGDVNQQDGSFLKTSTMQQGNGQVTWKKQHVRTPFIVPSGKLT
jgi:hypothetical protein